MFGESTDCSDEMLLCLGEDGLGYADNDKSIWRDRSG